MKQTIEKLVRSLTSKLFRKSAGNLNGSPTSGKTGQQVTMMPNPPTDGVPKDNASTEADDIPDELKSVEAKNMMQKLHEQGYIDEKWQPIRLTSGQCATIAWVVSEKLGITHKWVVFAKLWKKKPHTMRANYNRFMDQNRKGGDFLVKIRNVLKDT